MTKDLPREREKWRERERGETDMAKDGDMTFSLKINKLGSQTEFRPDMAGLLIVAAAQALLAPSWSCSLRVLGGTI